MSQSRALRMTKNCYSQESCFVWSADENQVAMLMPKDFVERISCNSQGKLKLVRHEPYNGGDFFRIDCRIGNKLVSKVTVWSIDGTGASVDIAPCELGICTFPQPI
jgi:hypothetical protein